MQINIKKLTKPLLIIFCISASLILFSFIAYMSDLNRIKKFAQKIIQNQLNCDLFFDTLKWERQGVNFGVGFGELTIIDKKGNLIIQSGPTKIFWSLKNVLRGRIAFFHKIESKDLYVDIQRYTNGKINLIEIFPPNKQEFDIDNLILDGGSVLFKDYLNTKQNTITFKDIHLSWSRNKFTKTKKIILTSNLISANNKALLKIKGFFTYKNQFSWKKDLINLYISAKNIKLDGFETYLKGLPQVKSLEGNFTGVIYLKKDKGKPFIDIKARTYLDNFKAHLENEFQKDIFKLPRTHFSGRGKIEKKKITIYNFDSRVHNLKYYIKGIIENWSTTLPEIDINFKTNKFNFLNLKENLPLALLPGSTRAKIEPIKDDGFITLDINAKGPAIAPKYFGTILLDDFNLSPESGFLEFIHGLNAKLVLNDELLKIEYLNIPINKSNLQITGEVNNKTFENNINIKVENVDIGALQGVVVDFDPNIHNLLNDVQSYGNFSLNLNVMSAANKAPDITGMVSFNDTGFVIIATSPIFELSKVNGEFNLDGNNVIFKKINGLINEKPFSVNGSISIKEDENINIHVQADKLKVLSSILAFASNYAMLAPVITSLKGGFSDLDIAAYGKISNPNINGMLTADEISFAIPKQMLTVNSLTGNVLFNEKIVNLENVAITINETSMLFSNIAISDYFTMTPGSKGFFKGDLDPHTITQVLIPEFQMNLKCDGTIPILVNFAINNNLGNVNFNLSLAETLMLDFEPYISKPTNLAYNIKGDFDVDIKNSNIKVNDIGIKSKGLILNTYGVVNNYLSKEPFYNFKFYSTPPTGTYMLIKPFIRLKDNIKLFGDIEIEGLLMGTPSKPDLNFEAQLSMLKIQPVYDPNQNKRVDIENGTIKLSYMDKKGDFSAQANSIDYFSFHGMTANLHATYNDPIINIDKFHLDVDPGFIDGSLLYNIKDTSININSITKQVQLSKLGEFIFKDPKKLDGTTNLDIMLITKGMTSKQLISNAMGDITLSIDNGHIGEIALLHKGLQAASIFKQGLFGINLRNLFTLFFDYKDGSFKNISSDIKIRKGILNFEKFHFRANNLLLNMFGKINLKELETKLSLYGYIPDKKETIIIGGQEFIIEGGGNTDALAVSPALLKKRFVIPFISSTPPQHFKLKIEGNLKDQNKISKKAIRSFKWVKGKQLQKEYQYFPQPPKQ